jgi:hypothetical protein
VLVKHRPDALEGFELPPSCLDPARARMVVVVMMMMMMMMMVMMMMTMVMMMIMITMRKLCNQLTCPPRSRLCGPSRGSGSRGACGILVPAKGGGKGQDWW